MMRRVAWLVFLLALLTIAILLTVYISRRDGVSSDGPLGGYGADWSLRLARHAFNGQHVGSLEDELGTATRNSGRYAHGGTGQSTMYYQVAEDVVVGVDLSFDDKIIGEPFVGYVKEWPEVSNGYFTKRPELTP